jgi:dUTP pyrophosphatase
MRPKRTRAGRGPVEIRIERLAHARGLALPAYQTPGAAGLDLVAAVPSRQPLVLAPGKWALVPTGLRLELPQGYEAQVRPRSGLAMRHGLTVLNSPGTIDSDYRGEVQVLLINLGAAPWAIERGERIAQLVVQPVAQATLVEVGKVGATERGAGGFGSTGLASRRAGQKGAGAPQQAGPAKSAATRGRRTSARRN